MTYNLYKNLRTQENEKREHCNTPVNNWKKIQNQFNKNCHVFRNG